MEQGDKELLLKYLCMASPYGLQVKTDEDNEPYTLLSIHPNKGIALILTGVNMDGVDIISKVKIDTIKPYLRPMSSMTKEEEKEFNEQMYNAKPYSDGKSYNVYEVIGLDINYLNAHHFDYFGLIEKGCAIKVTEDNNPYKIVEEQI
ncbi:MAG: hypothetical protein VZR53_05660 [Prevotella sp.]|nr:hypothetical protein [Prevotella sp.]